MTKKEAQIRLTDLIHPGINAQYFDKTIEPILKRIYARECNTCVHIQNRVCTNSYSLMYADYPPLEMSCKYWE